MTSDLPSFTTAVQKRLESQLEATFSALPAHNTRLIDAMRYSLLGGGKRMRPLLAYAVAHALDTPVEQVDPVALAVECVHVYSLIHDDLPAMDDDALRRGKATCHIAFDEATAILAGDALLTLAFTCITEDERLSDRQKVLISAQLARRAGASGMVMGQAIDLHWEKGSPPLEVLEDMHQLKTGALIQAAVAMGALACGASTKDREALEVYAAELGLAFQIHDDVLDVIGSTETLGKPQGSDADLDKATFVSHLGLDRARQAASEHVERALASLAGLGDRANILRELARYAISRDR